jgi:biopolymer transport protein ExbB
MIFQPEANRQNWRSSCPGFRQYAKVLAASGQLVLQPIRSPDLLSLIQAAGWPIWFIILCSILAVAIIGERFWTLRRNAAIPPNLFHDTVQAFRQQGGSRELIDRLSENSFLGRIFASGVANVQSSRELMKESMEEAGRAVMVDMERFLNGLGTIATVAPLLGLFGTVVGMIEIFGASGASGQNPAQLAHGISVALYNTAAGIAVAVPALIFYRHFRARIDVMIVDMEQQGIKLVETIHGDRA